MNRTDTVDVGSKPGGTPAVVDRLESFPPGAKVRHWVIRDDNNQHYHGVVPLSETPLFVDLRWKPAANGPEQHVGNYRLRLPELLAGDFARFEREGEKGDGIRLRFVRGAGGAISIQSKSDRPALGIGRVKL
jgi:hypothetical protein